MARLVRIFLDTSALFAAIWSESGGGRLILKLGEAGTVQIVIGKQVLSEADEVLRRKHPSALPGLVKLLDRSLVEVASDADTEIVRRCRELVGQPGDVLVLAEAWSAGVDFFATHDLRHLSGNASVVRAVPFLVGSPGDFLAWYRAGWVDIKA